VKSAEDRLLSRAIALLVLVPTALGPEKGLHTDRLSPVSGRRVLVRQRLDGRHIRLVGKRRRC
jgi:hypothetical protein